MGLSDLQEQLHRVENYWNKKYENAETRIPKADIEIMNNYVEIRYCTPDETDGNYRFFYKAKYLGGTSADIYYFYRTRDLQIDFDANLNEAENYKNYQVYKRLKQILEKDIDKALRQRKWLTIDQKKSS